MRRRRAVPGIDDILLKAAQVLREQYQEIERLRGQADARRA
jgi:hypothetical protein